MMNPFADKGEYAISTWTLEAVDLKTALRLISRHGFRSVELWADTVHFDPRAKVDRNDIRTWLREYGLRAHSAHAPFRHFFDRPKDDDEFRLYRMKLWHDVINDCERLEIPILVVHALDRVEYAYAAGEAGVIRDCLADLCNYAERKSIAIALENISDNYVVGKDDISCTLKNQKELFPGLGLKYCLDIGHVPLSRAEAFDEIDAAGDSLVTFHIHNNDGVFDSHDLPDRGVLDWPKIRRYIRDRGYTGEFVLEVFGGDDPQKKMEEISALFGSA